MNDILLRIIKKISQDVIAFLTKCKNNRILFIHESSSGSNTYALLKHANEGITKKYDIISIYDSEPKTIIDFVKKYRLLSSAKLIITTHSSYKPSRKNIHLQLWHGALIKKNGVMLGTADKNMFGSRNTWRKADYIMSYSQTYTTFMNACMVTDPNKFIVTGAPRNDFLYSADGKSKMSKIFGNEIKDYNIIFFMPTFSENKASMEEGNKLFNFDEFSLKNFDQFLEKNKCKLVFKPHPHEEKIVLKHFLDNNLNNFLILRNSDLFENHFDLYELINASKILITDHSSVFYDFLLLDRPIVFTPVDDDSYHESRGFLVESFKSWAPGPMAFNQDELQFEISKCISDKDYYSEKRAWIRNLNHRYKDGQSSERLWRFIDNVMP